jgi:GxxExxY protein
LSRDVFLTQSREGAKTQRKRQEGDFFDKMTENELSKIIVGAAIEVHRSLGGPGLIESVYEESLAWEMTSQGLNVQSQIAVPIKYKGNLLATPLRLDLLVNDQVIVEVKSVTVYNKIFESQLLTYLRLTELKLGLVINFGESRVANGVHRVVNGLEDDRSIKNYFAS